MTAIHAALEEDRVIPDVLPKTTHLPSQLTVEWPTVDLTMPGQKIDRQATQPTPKVVVHPVPQETVAYTLIMTDPDLTTTNDTRLGQVHHWLETDLTVGSDGEVALSTSGNSVSPYVGPAPMPGTGDHRYTFVLCRQSAPGGVVSQADKDLEGKIRT